MVELLEFRQIDEFLDHDPDVGEQRRDVPPLGNPESVRRVLAW
jgi:hypothetical protein